MEFARLYTLVVEVKPGRALPATPANTSDVMPARRGPRVEDGAPQRPSNAASITVLTKRAA